MNQRDECNARLRSEEAELRYQRSDPHGEILTKESWDAWCEWYAYWKMINRRLAILKGEEL